MPLVCLFSLSIRVTINPPLQGKCYRDCSYDCRHSTDSDFIFQDLSLLTHLSQADIQHLQSVGKDAQAARQQFILRDDEEPVWKHIQTLKDGRVDFVLDNCMLWFFIGKTKC